jgi:hypothetical protein
MSHFTQRFFEDKIRIKASKIFIENKPWSELMSSWPPNYHYGTDKLFLEEELAKNVDIYEVRIRPHSHAYHFTMSSARLIHDSLLILLCYLR